MQISRGQTQVGVVTYANNANLQIPMNRYSDVTSLQVSGLFISSSKALHNIWHDKNLPERMSKSFGDNDIHNDIQSGTMETNSLQILMYSVLTEL